MKHIFIVPRFNTLNIIISVTSCLSARKSTLSEETSENNVNDI